MRPRDGDAEGGGLGSQVEGQGASQDGEGETAVGHAVGRARAWVEKCRGEMFGSFRELRLDPCPGAGVGLGRADSVLGGEWGLVGGLEGRGSPGGRSDVLHNGPVEL